MAKSMWKTHMDGHVRIREWPARAGLKGLFRCIVR